MTLFYLTCGFLLGYWLHVWLVARRVHVWPTCPSSQWLGPNCRRCGAAPEDYRECKR